MDTLRDALDPAVSRWDFEHALLVRQQLLVLENERLRLAAGVAEAEAAALAGHSSAAALPKPWRGATATRKVSPCLRRRRTPFCHRRSTPRGRRLGAARESSFSTLAPLAGESWLSESARWRGRCRSECLSSPPSARLAALDLPRRSTRERPRHARRAPPARRAAFSQTSRRGRPRSRAGGRRRRSRPRHGPPRAVSVYMIS